MMEQMPGIPKWGGWQGTRELRPDVCFASLHAICTPNGKLSQTSEVRIYERPLFQKARWQGLPDPLCPLVRSAGAGGQAHSGDLSTPALWSPLSKISSGPDSVGATHH